jgi:hypothetical protein
LLLFLVVVADVSAPAADWSAAAVESVVDFFFFDFFGVVVVSELD